MTNKGHFLQQVGTYIYVVSNNRFADVVITCDGAGMLWTLDIF